MRDRLQPLSTKTLGNPVAANARWHTRSDPLPLVAAPRYLEVVPMVGTETGKLSSSIGTEMA